MTVDYYTNNTKVLLKHYRSMQKELQELDKKRKALADKVQHQYIAPSIAQYGGSVATQGMCNSPVESFANSHMDNVYKWQETDKAYKTMACTLKAVQTALGWLSEDDSKTISLHYIDGLPWTQVASVMGRSRKWCSIVGNNAIVKLSLLLYGSTESVKRFSN